MSWLSLLKHPDEIPMNCPGMLMRFPPLKTLHVLHKTVVSLTEMPLKEMMQRYPLMEQNLSIQFFYTFGFLEQELSRINVASIPPSWVDNGG